MKNFREKLNLTNIYYKWIKVYVLTVKIPKLFTKRQDSIISSKYLYNESDFCINCIVNGPSLDHIYKITPEQTNYKINHERIIPVHSLFCFSFEYLFND
ncbi:hypothetical protein MCM1_1559 [Methanosarcina barkeri CM1]|uniref:Uncharacterized protein n=1 Tax=Methanosarcina barkeri CM1 TaxID=796385 RepID=A0A0G3C9B0_METBA|nr:hypothetical protein MCM1_1559 [Methanosarcina barkeri CM1]